MSVFADLWKSIGGWLSPPTPPDDVAAAKNPPPQGAGIAQPTGPQGRFDPIRLAVEARLGELVRLEIPEHRQIAERDVLELHYIEVSAVAEGQELLESFCREFKPAARQEWIRRQLGGNGMVRLDCFAGVFGNAEMPATSNLDMHEQMLRQGVAPTYSVRLWGTWVQQQTGAEAGAAKSKGQPILIRVSDAQGRRPAQHLDTYPIKIGRSGSADVVAVGTFVSGEHCSLHHVNGHVWLEDHSKNGTYLDGGKTPPKQRVELAGSQFRLKLGKASGEAKDCPDIELEFTSTPVAYSSPTPIDTGSATPVAGVGAAAVGGELLAVLAIEDATGKPQRDVLAVPYTIGRAADCDYVTPPANAGVSSQHLRVQAITADGAEVLNNGKNGTALGGEIQAEEFFWPFDAEIVLAAKWRQDPPVRITLKRP
ncbi:MAG: FHA domain-containing protein [Candidatus Methylumidiphilus sp.]